VRIYIAGPMTGLPGFNYAAFNNAAAQLRGLGYEVENPAENLAPPCKTWRGYMRLAIRQLVTCDVVALLPGWEESRGARIERRIANDLEMRALPVQELLP
jgi:hypothetical protein